MDNEYYFFSILKAVSRLAVVWRAATLWRIFPVHWWGALTLLGFFRGAGLYLTGGPESGAYLAMWLWSEPAWVACNLLAALEAFRLLLPQQSSAGQVWLRRAGIAVATPVATALFAAIVVEQGRTFVAVNFAATRVFVFSLALSVIATAAVWIHWTRHPVSQALSFHSSIVAISFIAGVLQVLAQRHGMAAGTVDRLGNTADVLWCASWYFVITRQSYGAGAIGHPDRC